MIFAETSLAYIDPGTMQHMFGSLGPFLAVLLAALGVLAWPFRFVYYRARAWWRQLSKVRRRVVWVSGTAFAVLLMSAAAWAVFAPNPAAKALARTGPDLFERVIVLGMDGLDPAIVEEMMDAGQLPNFAKLAAAGSYARLATTTPPESPVAWSTIATGCNPGEHGIFDFLHRRPETYTPYLSLRKSTAGLTGTQYTKARARDGFWVYTSAAKIPTTVIRWPVAFPAEEVAGRFLSGFGVPDLVGGEGKYAYYTSAAVPGDDPSKRNVVKVAWDGSSTKTQLQGPAKGENSYATLAMSISRRGPDHVAIAIAGADTIDAKLGEWSAWVRVRFSVGLQTVYGMVKFLLCEAEPNLRLVCSPIHPDPKHPAFPFTWPESFAEELEERLGGPFHTLGMPEQVHPLSHGRYGPEAFLAECRAVQQERRKMLDLELSRFDRGLLAFVFDTSDRVQHAFWASRDPDHPAYLPEDAAKYADVIPAMYREMDEIVGDVLARLKPGTLLLVLSDHGFSSFRRAVHLNRWLIHHGYMNLAPGNEREGRDLFQDVDWPRTKAYAVGFASIYLNVKGREGKGIVDRSREYRSLCDEIAAKLRAWQDPDAGQPICHDVYLGTDLYHGPAAAEAPDLVIGLNPGYRASWQTALGGAPMALVEDNTKRWSGDHLIDPKFVPGILFSNHPLTVPDPAAADICPTVLRCFGMERPAFMSGKPLF